MYVLSVSKFHLRITAEVVMNSTIFAIVQLNLDPAMTIVATVHIKLQSRAEMYGIFI